MSFVLAGCLSTATPQVLWFQLNNYVDICLIYFLNFTLFFVFFLLRVHFTEVGELSLNVIVYILLITIFNYFIIRQIIIKMINSFLFLTS